MRFIPLCSVLGHFLSVFMRNVSVYPMKGVLNENFRTIYIWFNGKVDRHRISVFMLYSPLWVTSGISKFIVSFFAHPFLLICWYSYCKVSVIQLLTNSVACSIIATIALGIVFCIPIALLVLLFLLFLACQLCVKAFQVFLCCKIHRGGFLFSLFY